MAAPGKASSKKTKKTPAKAVAQKVCEACGALNAQKATECSACGKERFAPDWVLQLRRINRSFAVQVTKAHPSADNQDPRLTLYKWWPGSSATFNITRPSDWEQIKEIVDTELAPFLKWSTPGQAKKQLRDRTNDKKDTETLLGDLVSENPGLIAEIVKKIDLSKVTDESSGGLADALGDIAQVLVAADELQRLQIRELVKKLPAQGKIALQQLADLMEDLTVRQITAVTGEVKRRAGLLNLFKERVLDERTYEIRGDGSIHRLLEQAMWIVDDRYWLMHSNKQLRTVIGNDLAKTDKKFEKQRPDFVCGTVDKRLIIIEIKRPSHVLDVADLNQLERYIVIAREYDSYSSFEAILVGSKKSADLTRTLDVRGSSFKVRTYTELVADTERRYETFLKALES